MAIGVNDIALDCRRHAGSSQRFPTIEGAQETSNAPLLAKGSTHGVIARQVNA